ncbi:MAG: SRPBCC family protein [Byssovorax sp.]
MTIVNSDRIEKTLLLKAPRARVWKAIADAGEFGTWFRARLEGSFAVGKSIRGKITYPGFEHLTVEMSIERMDAEHLFSFRWHPYAIDPKIDYSTEPTTLVEIRLEDAPGGTQITVVESGFDKLPAERRAEAFRMNEGGWASQLENIQRHVAG